MTDVGDLVVIVPMRGRAHRIPPLLSSLDRTVPGARVLFMVSPDDGPVRRAVDHARRERIIVPYAIGDFARKINTGYRATEQPLIFCAADDLEFHPGWFEAACAQLRPGIGVVGVNDLGSPRVINGEHATHWLVTRDYADSYGTVDAKNCICHEGYWHEYVDDELVGTAKHRGAWAFAADSHVEHLHPNWGKAPMDDLYAQQFRRMLYGRRIFNSRRRLWT